MTVQPHADTGQGAPHGRQPGSSYAVAAGATATGALTPAELRPPAVRRRPPLVADLLDAQPLQSGDRERFDFGAGQRPRRPIVGIAALVAGTRDNQQGSTACHHEADVRDRREPSHPDPG